MARGVNLCIFIGNLGADPKWEPNKGSGRCAWSMAVTESWRDRDGNKQERTDWVHVVAWGPLGKLCSEYLSKGRQVFVKGAWRVSSWDGQDGKKQYRTEIEAKEVEFLGGGEQRQGQQQSSGQGYAPPPPGDDDLIPF